MTKSANSSILKSTFSYRVFYTLFKESLVWLETIGEIGSNWAQSMKYILTGKVSIKHTTEQSARFGFDSLPISLSVTGITGMIMALQVAFEMVKQGAGAYVGMLVAVSIVREIGPIMASFAVISMVGSSMSAEIATMKVTEQVDAIKVLRVDPIIYLLAPRILAGIIMMPLIVILANTVGILGGAYTSNAISGLSFINYFQSVWNGLSEKDIWVSVLKAVVFGGLISLISTSVGYQTKGGAREVGDSTTKAVVWSFMAIVIADYIISLIFFN